MTANLAPIRVAKTAVLTLMCAQLVMAQTGTPIVVVRLAYLKHSILMIHKLTIVCCARIRVVSNVHHRHQTVFSVTGTIEKLIVRVHILDILMPYMQVIQALTIADNAQKRSV